MNKYRWKDLELGLNHEFQVTLTNEMMTYFLENTGDCNPLHIDSSYALEIGFKGRVAYGLLTSSFYSTLVGVYLPGKFCLLHGIDVSFLNPAFVGDRLTISGVITYMNDAYQQIQISAQIVNARGEKISKAKIKLGVLNNEEMST